MSNLDPFTQKLLERTQARKEAAKSKYQLPGLVVSNRPPLSDKNGQQHLSPVKNTGQNKRRSSEGIHDTSLDKKQKIHTDLPEESLLFSKRQTDKYVVPSTAGRTPKKVGGLANRLASLNRDYEEKFQLDVQEEQRLQEAQQIQDARREEHLKIQEEEKARLIQERIFGKKYNVPENSEATSKTLLSDAVSARPSIRSVAIGSTNRISAKATSVFEKQDMENKVAVGKSHHKEAEERRKQTADARGTKGDEEKLESASVCDKMSIFEKKMKEEREARKKELEVENRLKQKTPRKLVEVKETQVVEVEKSVPVKQSPVKKQSSEKNASPKKKLRDETRSPAKLNPPRAVKSTHSPSKMTEEAFHIENSEEEEEEEVEIDHMVLSLKSPIPGKGTTGMRKHYANKKSSSSLEEAKCETPQKSELSLKNYTGDINSPQPTDYTEDTTVLKDSTAFDISEILRVAEEEQITSPSASKTPHRSSTMKVQASVPVRPMTDIDLTPTTFVEEGEEDESLSDFARQLRSKKKEIKTFDQTRKLLAIDNKIETESKKEKEKPPKPPRADRYTVHETALPPAYDEFIAEKKEKALRQIFPDDGKEEGVVEKPVEITPKDKNLKRSNSFTDTHTKTPVKSGYHGDSGGRYNACSNSDKPDIGFSKRDQIQNLLEEAAYQQNIVLQTSQALNVAENSADDKRGSPEVIEGERLLLLATEKRTVCLEEVRKLKQTDSEQCPNEFQSNPPCKATLALTDIKLPLHHDFVQTLRNGRMDMGVFHFVIIVSCGSKNVYSSKVISTYDEMEGDNLLMQSNILMSNVPHDFTLTAKVFGLHTKKTNDPHGKLKRTYTNSQSPGNLKNLFSKRREDEVNSHASPQTVFRTSNFKLVGETKINLSILGNGGKHVLTNVPSNCPIEGFLQMRVGCKPEFSASATGFLTVLEDVGGYTAWNRRWCNMRDNKILYWRYPDDEETKEPLGCIDLRFCTDKMMSLLSRDKCARPHTFELNVKRPKEKNDVGNLITTLDGKHACVKHWICCDNKGDRVVWMDAVNKQLSDSRAWLLKHASKTKPASKSNEIISSEHGKAFYV